MYRKIQILNLFIALAMLALAGCASQPPNRAQVTSAPATQETVATQPAFTETFAPQMTELPVQESATPASPGERAICSNPVELTPVDEIISYKYVQFRLDDRLGFHFNVRECSGGTDEGGMGTVVFPPYLVFRSDSPLANHYILPEIRVYEVNGDLQSYTYPLNSLAELQLVLDERPEPSPWYAGAALHAGEIYLNSHYGIGVRALVEVHQGIFFWINNDLQYTYNGLTDDGRHFVSASFPLSAPFLMDIQDSDPLSNTNPDAIPISGWPEDYEQQGKIIAAYNQEAVRFLEGSSPSDFTPVYDWYDDLVLSLQIDAPSPAVSSVDPACFTPMEILPMAFTPDSRSLLVRAQAGVQFINLDSLQEERFLKASQNIIAAALSPDGSILAWSLQDNKIQMVQVTDQKVLQTLAGHTDMVTKLRFTPDGSRLVWASHDRSVRVWDLEGKELRSFQPPGEVLGIGISPDGSLLASVPFDGPVMLWDLKTFEKVRDLSGNGGYDTSDPEFSPDGVYVGADLASSLFLWRVGDGKTVWNEIRNSMTISFSPDGRYLAYADINDSSKIFLSTPDGSQIVRVLPGDQGPVWALFFSPNSQLLASSGGPDIRIWRVEDGSLLYVGKSACP